MYAKLLKIVALGMGAVMTTGIPSGTISIGPSPMANVQVHQPYELRQNSQPWKDDETITFKYEAASETSGADDQGTEEETCEFPDFLEPTEFRPAPMGKVGPRPKSSRSSNSKPIRLPRTQIVVLLEAPVPRRDSAIGYLTEQADYGPGVSYSGTLFQPPTSRVAPLQSYSEEWWEQHSEGSPEELDLFRMAGYGDDEEETGAPIATGSTDGPPAQPAVEPVPEPAGALAIMAGLPGIAMLWRRKRSSAAN